MENSTAGTKILILGTSSREHVLASACASSSSVAEVIIAPGNAGIASNHTCAPIDLSMDSLYSAINEYNANVVIIGSKRFLKLGAVNALREKGILAFGPTKEQVAFEEDELFLKKFLQKHDVPTASWAYFTSPDAAIRGLQRERFPAVLKVSSLPAGRNVTIAANFEEAEKAVQQLTEEGVFGGDNQWMLAEDYLVGEPVSASIIMAGEKYTVLPLCKCYKRIGEKNTGPNTPGVGAYTPSSYIKQETEDEIHRTIIDPFLKGLRADGYIYTGPLYIGVMLTRNGPRVFDVKVRFGDPELQAINAILDRNLIDLILDALKNDVKAERASTTKKTAVAISKTMTGYPEKSDQESVIPTPHLQTENVSVYHSNTAFLADNTVQTQGGRPLSITAHADTLLEALIDCYAACEQTAFDSEYYRKDIGLKEIEKIEVI